MTTLKQLLQEKIARINIVQICNELNIEDCEN